MEQLIRKARQKDPDAFVQLMQLYMQDMYKVARSYLKNDEDAADAISDTILACYEKIHTLKKDKYFKTWMTRILINKCNDMLHKKKTLVLSDYTPEPAFWEEDYTNLEWNQVLLSLDEKYRLVVMLYYVEGFKIREIAQILDVSESTIQTRLARAREKLSKEYLNETRRSAHES
ncbi:MAG: RNA polymerase sigma factor [Blautia sp.]